MGRGGSAGIATGAAAALLALAGPALAADRYASPAGGGDDDCSSAAEACDIVTAINETAEGDRVILLRGASAPDYTITTSLVPTFNVTIEGEAGGRRPVIQHIAASAERALFLTDDLEHVEIRRYVGSGPALEIAYAATARDVVVRNYAQGTAVAIGSGAFDMFGGTLEDSLAVASNANSQAVRSTGLGHPAVVRNVTAIAPGAGSVAVDALETGQELEPGVCVAPVVGTLSARNVIARGGAADLATSLTGCDAPDADATVGVGHSNYRAAAVIEQSGEVDESPGGNQTQPPDTDNDTVFADFAAGDYHQAPGSPTIDAALAASLGSIDFDGDARVLEGGVDIGADEMIPPPPVSVAAPSEIGQTFAVLAGSADPLGRPLTASFEWGPTSAYGSVTPLQSIAGTGAQPVSAPLFALIPATTYHFRLTATATNANGEQSRSAVSADQAFTTLAPPGPEPDSAAPNTRFTKRPKNRVRARSARFSFAADEQGARFQCRRDLGRWRSCNSPSRWSRLRRGRHLFQVRGIDEAGNIDPTPAEDGFRVLRKKQRR